MVLLARCHNIKFDVRGELAWFPYDFGNCVLLQRAALKGKNCGRGFTQAVLRAPYWTGIESNSIKTDFVKLTLHRNWVGESDLREIFSIVDAREFIVTGVAEAEDVDVLVREAPKLGYERTNRT